MNQKSAKTSEFHSYISDDNEQDACDSHAHMVRIFKKDIELRLLDSLMSNVWEDTGGCEKVI